jgi:hypothetical protein
VQTRATPWWRRKLPFRERVPITALAAVGLFLGLFTEPIALRLLGVALIWGAVAVWVVRTRSQAKELP